MIAPALRASSLSKDELKFEKEVKSHLTILIFFKIFRKSKMTELINTIRESNWVFHDFGLVLL